MSLGAQHLQAQDEWNREERRLLWRRIQGNDSFLLSLSWNEAQLDKGVLRIEECKGVRQGESFLLRMPPDLFLDECLQEYASREREGAWEVLLQWAHKRQENIWDFEMVQEERSDWGGESGVLPVYLMQPRFQLELRGVGQIKDNEQYLSLGRVVHRQNKWLFETPPGLQNELTLAQKIDWAGEAEKYWENKLAGEWRSLAFNEWSFWRWPECSRAGENRWEKHIYLLRNFLEREEGMSLTFLQKDIPHFLRSLQNKQSEREELIPYKDGSLRIESALLQRPGEFYLIPPKGMAREQLENLRMGALNDVRTIAMYHLQGLGFSIEESPELRIKLEQKKGDEYWQRVYETASLGVVSEQNLPKMFLLWEGSDV
jgi:hypothetical protein